MFSKRVQKKSKPNQASLSITDEELAMSVFGQGPKYRQHEVMEDYDDREEAVRLEFEESERLRQQKSENIREIEAAIHKKITGQDKQLAKLLHEKLLQLKHIADMPTSDHLYYTRRDDLSGEEMLRKRLVTPKQIAAQRTGKHLYYLFRKDLQGKKMLQEGLITPEQIAAMPTADHVYYILRKDLRAKELLQKRLITPEELASLPSGDHVYYMLRDDLKCVEMMRNGKFTLDEYSRVDPDKTCQFLRYHSGDRFFLDGPTEKWFFQPSEKNNYKHKYDKFDEYEQELELPDAMAMSHNMDVYNDLINNTLWDRFIKFARVAMMKLGIYKSAGMDSKLHSETLHEDVMVQDMWDQTLVRPESELDLNSIRKQFATSRVELNPLHDNYGGNDSKQDTAKDDDLYGNDEQALSASVTTRGLFVPVRQRDVTITDAEMANSVFGRKRPEDHDDPWADYRQQRFV